MQAWLRKHKFEVHSIAFLLMILPPVALFWVAREGNVIWIILLLLPIVLGNVIELFIE